MLDELYADRKTVYRNAESSATAANSPQFYEEMPAANTNKQFILLCERKETVSLQLSTSCMPPFAYAREGF